jgi:predicted amidohydrolase YtcJ
VASLADALRLLKEQAARTPAPQWVRVVGGWTEFQFAERHMPTMAEINAASADTPVLVLHLMLQMGIPVGAGTDATRVASYNPWVSLYWLVAGKTVGGTPLYPEANRLDRMEAPRRYK